jgi:hypothetical protein
VKKLRPFALELVTALLLLSPWLPAAAPAPEAGPEELLKSAPSSQPTEQDRRRARELTRRSLELLHDGKFADAEPVLLDALAIEPDHTTNLYNLACVKARSGKPDEAIDYLERAGEAGYTDFIHLARDPDLDGLREMPRFRQFVARKDEFQRKSADRAVAKLKEGFGEGYLFEVDEQNKLIFATNVDSATLAALKNWLLAQARSQWGDLFEHKPDEYITVVVPSGPDYRKIVRSPGVGGIYMDTAKTLIARQLGQVMTHEFTHALHAADKAPLGQDHPIWLVEGIASMYEAAQFDGEGDGRRLVPADNFRLTFLQRAAKSGRLIALEKLLSMKQGQFVARANLAYGQSSSVMLYLYEHDLLRKFYEAYKAGYDQDSTGRAALEQVTGKSLGELEKAWKDWMVARTPPPLHTGPDGAFMGAQLDGANDGITIKHVVPGGPASRGGLKAGDVIVGLAGREVRDYQSFAPMLSRHQPGEQVTLRVRRGDEYLDLPMVLGKRSDPPGTGVAPKFEGGGDE